MSNHFISRQTTDDCNLSYIRCSPKGEVGWGAGNHTD